MKIIEKMNWAVEKSVSLQKVAVGTNCTRSIYLKTIEVEDGLLVYNTLTGEIILMSKGEYENPSNELMEWMTKHWFYLPSDFDPKTIARMVKQAVDARKGNNKNDNSFVVLTTTVCNARCFYCYESGFHQKPMSDKVALDTAKYIVQKSNGNKVHITWFGGEPLCNPNAIRTITDHLRKSNIKYVSTMVSNGYLFDSFSIEEIKEKWNLTHVQITLDGTKDVYLVSKNYKNEDPNAFEHVIDNMRSLLENNIGVTVRMNVSLKNKDDLINLVHYLHENFSKFKNFGLYANELFIGEGDPPLELTEEETDKLFSNVVEVFKAIDLFNNNSKLIELSEYPRSHCMADSGSCKVITIDGNLTPCEHYVYDELCGNIYDGVTDKESLESWTRTIKTKPECDTCYNYPRCMKIAKCPSDNVCEAPQRKLMDFKIETKMKLIYQKYKENERTQ